MLKKKLIYIKIIYNLTPAFCFEGERERERRFENVL
jgi:hypothetical protein